MQGELIEDTRTMFGVVAWMGGSSPLPWQSICRDEKTLVSMLFREQMHDWLDYWGDMPNRDTRKIFWCRARYDAHATFRHKGKHG